MLPQNIKNLRNLRQIICIETKFHIPIGMGEFIHLQTSPKLLMKIDNHDLAKLKNCCSLKLDVKIGGLVPKYFAHQNKMVKLYTKPYIKELQLEWE